MHAHGYKHSQQYNVGVLLHIIHFKQVSLMLHECQVSNDILTVLAVDVHVIKLSCDIIVQPW